MLSNILTVSLFTLLVGARPMPFMKRTAAYDSNVQIHESCNATQRRMLEKAFADTYEVAGFARDYIHKHGPQDATFQLYFGTKPEAYATVAGVYDAVLSSNKAEVIFRCDDIDGNCNQPGWRGHWRGNNATAETVICDASYTDRLYNAAFCMHGFELARDKPSVYWSIDLLHRLFHVPAVTNSAVNHYAEDLEAVVELAAHNSTYSPFDSDAVQYFAAHVYALEVARGGDKCIGEIKAHEHHSEPAPAATATPAPPAPPAATTEPAPAPPAEPAPAAPSAPAPEASSAPPAASAGQDCHTHADGTVHCV